MSDPKWVWWSTHETIQNEVPSVTAILETIIAVPLYWWIALHTGVVLPLLISAAVAPLVLLRSDQSVVLALKWFDKIEFWLERVGPSNPDNASWRSIILYIFFAIFCVPVIALFLSFATRFGATLVHLRTGIEMLPRNFRRLTLCWSPGQLPELVPGLTPESQFSLNHMYDQQLKNFDSRNNNIPLFLIGSILNIAWVLVMYVPAWLYRITIKSTTWFWWPLAFLGGDLKRVQNPALFHWQVMGSLWAKTSIVIAILSLAAFLAVNFVFDGTMLERNPLLTPVGYFLLIDWKLQIWQVCALSAAALSILIVYIVNDVSGQYRIAQDTGDAKLLEKATLKYGWIERLTRVRFLLLLAFWGLVGTHAVLYANSTKCWFSLPPSLQEWAQDIYGDRLPRSKECRIGEP